MSPFRIERAREGDVPDVLRLLERNHLPLDGLLDHLATLIVARSDEAVVGTAALELYGSGALLRSVSVEPAVQRHRLGHRLTDAAIEMAASAGMSAIYLLTTTAADFFPRFGFEPIARAEVPADVQRSVEFTSACPSSATVMRKVLQPASPIA
jgi:N-acetylglutamate synthase-like GNAT family acetyltransferase